MAIEVFVGPTGSAKTATMMFFLIQAYNKWHRPIYTNMSMVLPHTKVSTIEEIMEVGDGDLVLDELAQVLGDSRKSNAKDNVAGTIATAVVRKKKVGLYGSVQNRMMNDSRLRYNTNVEHRPRIIKWVNVVTGQPMKGPVNFRQMDMIEKTLDHNGDRVWHPAIIEVSSMQKDGDEIVRTERTRIDCQAPLYKKDGKWLTLLECYDTHELILKETQDHDAIKKAVALETKLTKYLRGTMWGYNILRMPRSGMEMSYVAEWIDYTALDIMITHPDGQTIWIDVVGLTSDKNGYETLITAHKKWDRILNSVRMSGPDAVAYIAFFFEKEWFLSKISESNEGLISQRGATKGLMKSGNLSVNQILPHCLKVDEWIELVRMERGGKGIAIEDGASLRFPARGWVGEQN